MQIRVDVDDYIDSNEELILRVEGVVEGLLNRFQGWISRVHVNLSQRRQADYCHMCCRIEADAGVLELITVSHEAATLTEAIHAASAKLADAVVITLNQPAAEDLSAVSARVEGMGPEGRLGPVRSS